MRFGELIALARELKGWTQRDLEKASGVNNALICQIETGAVKDTGFSTAIAIIDALGLTLERAANTVRAGALPHSSGEPRKHCFTYCGPDRCNCGAAESDYLLPGMLRAGDAKHEKP